MSEAAPRLLAGWAATTRSGANVIDVTSTTAVAAVLAEPGARGTIARGLGRSYGDAAQNAGGRVLSTPGLDRIVSLDAENGLVRVQAGVAIGVLNRFLLPLGWVVAAVPGTGRVTVGGAIASDDHGKNHHRDGGFCRHVESLQLSTAPGTTHELTRASDADAFLATAGGMGLTGIVTEATLRLQPVESAYVRVSAARADDLETVLARVLEASGRHVVTWLDLAALGRRLGRGIVAVGDVAAADELTGRERRDPYRLPARPAVRVWAPAGLARRSAIRAANELRFAAARSPSTRIAPLEAFQHPLDRIEGWSRLFGPAGLVEHHVVVPEGRADALHAIVETIARRRAPAALAAMKRLGAGTGLLSFPIAGWSLAVDYPASWPGLAALLDELDELVADAGGRVYLAKDSRLRPELVPRMYPELERWRSIQRRLDPERTMRSDLDRRLSLTG